MFFITIHYLSHLSQLTRVLIDKLSTRAIWWGMGWHLVFMWAGTLWISNNCSDNWLFRHFWWKVCGWMEERSEGCVYKAKLYKGRLFTLRCHLVAGELVLANFQCYFQASTLCPPEGSSDGAMTFNQLILSPITYWDFHYERQYRDKHKNKTWKHLLI